MRRLALTAVLAAALAGPALADDPTYTMTVTVGGIWGSSWVKSTESALSRLEGVKSAKVGSKKSLYVVKVLENKALTPEAVKKAIEGAKFSFEGLDIELVGKVAQDGENYTLTARANDTKYTLKANDDLKKLVADGKTTLLVKGELTRPEEKDKEGKLLPCVIEVSSAKEPPKEDKK